MICSVCGKIAEREGMFCTSCGGKLISQSSTESEQEEYTNEGSLRCQLCGRSFSQGTFCTVCGGILEKISHEHKVPVAAGTAGAGFDIPLSPSNAQPVIIPEAQDFYNNYSNQPFNEKERKKQQRIAEKQRKQMEKLRSRQK